MHGVWESVMQDYNHMKCLLIIATVLAVLSYIKNRAKGH
jgi:hypothetical protein